MPEHTSARDEDGYAVLMYAANSIHDPEMITALLKVTGGATAKDRREESAFEYAQFNGERYRCLLQAR